MSLQFKGKIIHSPRYDGIFNSLCFNKNIIWIFSCHQCGITMCMYCGKTVLKCGSCGKFRCQKCALEHDKTKCYLDVAKK